VIRVGILGDDPHPHVEAFISLGCEIVLGPVEELLSKVDAVVVASAPDERFHHTALALEHGLDVLIKQPVAPTAENAWMLERIATLRPAEPVVQVSQPYAFDPALARLAQDDSVAIDLRRRGDAPLEADVHTLLSLARSTGAFGSEGCSVRVEGSETSAAADLTPAYAAQAESFLTAVRERSRPRITLRDAIACMDVASGIRECLAVQAAASGSGVR
jgi:predicted dehydrogenase